MSNIGIYYIRNDITTQLYIGQSIDINKRKVKHFHDLRNNKHQNTHLQNSFNKYGEDNFSFGIIELCDASRLDELEIAYMNLYNVKSTGFNICDGGANVCPDNSNENHGMWRNDILNDEIKKLYLEDYTALQIAEIYKCSRRTINRRLKKIFGDEYDTLKKEKHKKGVRKINKKNPNYKDEDILKLAKKGLNSVEISLKIGCSDSTVMTRLKKMMSKQQYLEYKQRNTNRKCKEMRLKKLKKGGQTCLI